MHIGASFGWVKKIASIIKDADNQVALERRKMEGQFEERREKFTRLLDSYAQQVKDFAE